MSAETENLSGEYAVAAAAYPDLEENRVDAPKRGRGRPRKERPPERPPTGDEQRLAAARAADYLGEPHVESTKRYHVHFLMDGITLAGKVWYRGEEFYPRPGTQEYDLLFDIEGNCVLELTEDEQIERFGEVAWGQGKWPFKGYDPNAKFADGTPMSVQEQEKLAKINAIRARQPAPIS